MSRHKTVNLKTKSKSKTKKKYYARTYKGGASTNRESSILQKNIEKLNLVEKIDIKYIIDYVIDNSRPQDNKSNFNNINNKIEYYKNKFDFATEVIKDEIPKILDSIIGNKKVSDDLQIEKVCILIYMCMYELVQTDLITTELESIITMPSPPIEFIGMNDLKKHKDVLQEIIKMLDNEPSSKLKFVLLEMVLNLCTNSTKYEVTASEPSSLSAVDALMGKLNDNKNTSSLKKSWVKSWWNKKSRVAPINVLQLSKKNKKKSSQPMTGWRVTPS